ncbi:ras-related protein Rac1-like isoform X2 [Hydractinia symbiolongicarpus]|uniref:ras-related protein Rac1-like isoform X2 n=1 Tax=Hydractinia symbiolongicarpus TaxID=13093 RepID=UPI00255066E8|nr:ras-related protein Rac1-like isoform X2 [Hydractinia symbiolongicarpus]
MTMKGQITCVVVGDRYVGRTCLLIVYYKNTFPTGYIPSSIGIVAQDVELTETGCVIPIVVTEALSDNGSDEHDRLRQLDYEKRDVVLVCFSLSDRTSYEHVRTKWHLELKRYRPTAAIILVGTKLDTRDDKEYIEQNKLVAVEEGIQLAKEIGAAKYLECSALTQQGVKEAFDEVARAGILARRTKN